MNSPGLWPTGVLDPTKLSFWPTGLPNLLPFPLSTNLISTSSVARVAGQGTQLARSRPSLASGQALGRPWVNFQIFGRCLDDRKSMFWGHRTETTKKA